MDDDTRDDESELAPDEEIHEERGGPDPGPDEHLARRGREARKQGLARRRIAGRIAGFGAGWILDSLRFGPAMLFIGVGGALLSAGWLAGPERLELVHRLERFTARAEGRASHPFWRFDVDLEQLQGGWNWPAATRAELCAEVLITGIPTGPAYTTLCGARRARSAPWGILDTQALAPDTPIAWPRDAYGLPELDIRFSRVARDRLASQVANGWPLVGQSSEARDAMPPPGSELDQFLLEVDKPLEWLVRTWPSPPTGTIPLAYDPEHPEDALPVSVLESVRQQGPSWTMTGLFTAFGLAFWFAGITYGFAGSSRWLLGAVAIAPLLALPWWGDRFEPVLLWLEPRAGQVGADIVRDITEPLRLPVENRGRTAFADLVNVGWSLGTSYYDTLLGPFAPTPPDVTPSDSDAALSTAVAEVSDKMARADDEALLPLLTRLRHDEVVDRGEVGLLFLEGARRVALDDRRSPAVRSLASSFLWWLTVTPISPTPSGPAFRSRLELWKSLLDFPDPAVANMTRSLVDSLEAAQRQTAH